VPPESLAGAVSALTSNILKREKHLSVGGVGARWLLQALTAANETSLALDLAAQVRRQPCRFCAIFLISKRSFYQDRLGTNIGKALKKRAALSYRRPHRAGMISSRPGLGHCTRHGERLGCPGAETVSFVMMECVLS
jgi:hypothetical protein